MMALRNVKLKWKILLIVLAVIALSGTTFVVLYNHTVYAYEERLYSDVGDRLLESIRKVEGQLQRLQKSVTATATSDATQNTIRDIALAQPGYEAYYAHQKVIREINAALNQYSFIQSIYYISPDAYVTSIGSDTSFDAVRGNAEALHKLSLSQNGRYKWLSPLPGDSAVMLLCPIRERLNLSLKDMGAIVVRVSLAQVIQSAIALEHPGDALLVISEGEEICRLGSKMAAVDQIARLDFDQYELISQGGAKFFTVRQRSEYCGFEYYYAASYEAIFSEFDRVRALAVWVYSALALFLVIAALLYSQSITRPLNRLVEQMKKTTADNFPQLSDRILAEPSRDEIGILTGSYQQMLRRIERLIEENYVKQLVIKDTQYRSLQSQINPHFMYNALDSVYWMAINSGNPEVAQMVYSLGCLLRASTRKTENYGWKIALREELALLDHYVRIQKLRFRDRFEARVRVDESCLDALVPRMILQPLVENSIKYSIEVNQQPCTVTVAVGMDGDARLSIRVEDTGIGVPDDLQKKIENNTNVATGTGIGLNNILSRLNLLYEADKTFVIRNRSEGGTEVIIVIPFEAMAPDRPSLKDEEDEPDQFQ